MRCSLDLLTCIVIDEVGLPLVRVSLLPVRGERPQPVIVRGVRVPGVRVVFRDVALPAAPALVVRAHTCNVVRHHFAHFVQVVVVMLGLSLLPERLETARHGLHVWRPAPASAVRCKTGLVQPILTLQLTCQFLTKIPRLSPPAGGCLREGGERETGKVEMRWPVLAVRLGLVSPVRISSHVPGQSRPGYKSWTWTPGI